MVYNYTKPRGPIAAMYSSPGPCYALPGLVGQKTHDPRSEHNKGPAYPFGVRHGKFKDDCSPGPCYYPSPKYSRVGPDGVPHYSLYSRQKDGTMFKVPGPGAYSPEHSGPSAKFRAPTYLFGIRHRNKRTDNTPGNINLWETSADNKFCRQQIQQTTNSTDYKCTVFFSFSPENRFCCFMQIVSNGDSLHEMTKPILLEK